MATTAELKKQKYMRFTITQAAFEDDNKFIGRAYAGIDRIAHPGDLPYMWRVLDGDGEVYFEGECDDPGEFDEMHGCFAPQDHFESWGVVEMQYRPVDGSRDWETL